MIRAFVGIALALAAGACSAATDPLIVEGVVFQTASASYQHGDNARIVLRNATDSAIAYNLCQLARELRSGAGWTRFEPLRLCTDHLDILDPGEEVVVQEPITSEWQAGDYRLVTVIHSGGRRTEIVTPTFIVR